jgi:hypothetical protein
MKCCEKLVPSAGGYRQEGEVWTCPKCGSRWVHVVEESEGAWWEPMKAEPVSRTAYFGSRVEVHPSPSGDGRRPRSSE